MGRTYGGERFYENGVFNGKRALLSVTTGGPEAVYQRAAGTAIFTRSCVRFSGGYCASPVGRCWRQTSFMPGGAYR